MHADRSSHQAAYRRIADHLRAEIGHGMWAPGQRLPSESQLMQRYGVSRVTARQALGLLVTDGLLVSEQGRGWFVRGLASKARLDSGLFSRRSSSAIAIEPHGEPMKAVLLSTGRIAAPALATDRLELGAGATTFLYRRLYLTEETPIAIATSYVPMDVAASAQTDGQVLGLERIYAQLEDSGQTFERFDEDVTARMPDPQERRLLDLPPGSAVIQLTRTAIAGGRAVEVCEVAIDARTATLHYQVPA